MTEEEVINILRNTNKYQTYEKMYQDSANSIISIHENEMILFLDWALNSLKEGGYVADNRYSTKELLCIYRNRK